MSPQAWDASVDVYAFGITCWEILTRSTPFQHCESFADLVDEVAIGGGRPPLAADTPTELARLIGACWSADPAARPVLSRVLEALVFDGLLLEDAVPEATSRQFWANCFLRRSPNDVVPFGEFLSAFSGYFKTAAVAPDSLEAQCLRALMSDEHNDVRMEAFGLSARFFPPFGPEALAKMRRTLSAGWFHGPSSRADAEAALARARKPGSYLIRYAVSRAWRGVSV